PTVLAAGGQRHLLTHGDAWCLADTDYLKFRAQVRHSTWQNAFLSMSLEARLQTARELRDASEARKQHSQPDTWADVDEAFSARQMTGALTPILIHGHTHRPATLPFGPP